MLGSDSSGKTQDALRQLAAALGVEVSYLRNMPPEREQAVRNILDGL